MFVFIGNYAREKGLVEHMANIITASMVCFPYVMVCHNLQRRPYARPRARTDDQRIEVVGRSISLEEH